MNTCLMCGFPHKPHCPITEPSTEDKLQNKVAEYLDAREILWCHVPNGGKRDKIAGGKLKRMGAKRGVPDVLIFSPPPIWPDTRGPRPNGVALELKIIGGKPSKDQKHWLTHLKANGWHASLIVGLREFAREAKYLGW